MTTEPLSALLYVLLGAAAHDVCHGRRHHVHHAGGVCRDAGLRGEAGAQLIFTYIVQAALDRPEEWGGPHAELNFARMQKIVKARGEPLTLMSGYATGEMHSFLGRHGLLLEQDACEDACLAYLRQHGRTGRGPGGDVIAAVSGTSKVGGA